MRSLKALILIAVLFFVAGNAFAEKASLGFSTKVATEGVFFNPKLKRVVVDRVIPGSPAEKAGLQAKDDVISLNGKAIAGQSAIAMGSFMNSIQPGDHLVVIVKRPDGSEKTITIVAGSRSK